MCLIAFAINASSRWPLVIAANRDEYIERPTTPLTRWKTSSGETIISGRDLRAGGAWFGVTPGGRIAFLTNVREADALPAPRSRGELVTQWLQSRGDARAFVGRVTNVAGEKEVLAKPVLEGAPKADADAAKKKLEEAGAKVDVK